MHDSMFSGYYCDYDKRKIQISLWNGIEGVSQQFVLNNVILSQFQNCAFWGGGNTIYYICCYTEHPFFDQLTRIKAENMKNVDGSYLDMGTEFIVLELLLNSGGSLHAVCESVDYEVLPVARDKGAVLSSPDE